MWQIRTQIGAVALKMQHNLIEARKIGQGFVRRPLSAIVGSF
jgi:hypothetical protein